MALFYDFEQYFGFTELCKIETTYRFHQPLIDKSSAFVMKNPAQIAPPFQFSGTVIPEKWYRDS